MTIEITAPPASADVSNAMSKQAAAAAALLALTEMFGSLPAPYVVLGPHAEALRLQLRTPDAFEVWRVALVIPPDDVELVSWDGDTWLRGTGLFRGVPVELTGFGMSVPAAVTS